MTREKAEREIEKKEAKNWKLCTKTQQTGIHCLSVLFQYRVKLAKCTRFAKWCHRNEVKKIKCAPDIRFCPPLYALLPLRSRCCTCSSNLHSAAAFFLLSFVRSHSKCQLTAKINDYRRRVVQCVLCAWKVFVSVNIWIESKIEILKETFPFEFSVWLFNFNFSSFSWFFAVAFFDVLVRWATFCYSSEKFSSVVCTKMIVCTHSDSSNNIATYSSTNMDRYTLRV